MSKLVRKPAALKSYLRIDTSYSKQVKSLDFLYKKILKAHKDGSFTDETHGLFEIALKQFEAQIIEEYKSTQENEPPQGTQELIEPQVIKSIFNEFKI